MKNTTVAGPRSFRVTNRCIVREIRNCARQQFVIRFAVLDFSLEPRIPDTRNIFRSSNMTRVRSYYTQWPLTPDCLEQQRASYPGEKFPTFLRGISSFPSFLAQVEYTLVNHTEPATITQREIQRIGELMFAPSLSTAHFIYSRLSTYFHRPDYRLVPHECISQISIVNPVYFHEEPYITRRWPLQPLIAINSPQLRRAFAPFPNVNTILNARG